MNDGLRRFVLRLQVIEILKHYAEVRRQLHVLATWRNFLITPN
jgi:hypothetical protein